MIHDPPRSAAGFLGGPAQFDQFRDDDIAVIALNLDDAAAYRSARPAALLEPRGERIDVRRAKRQPRHRRDPLAGPTLGLAAYAHRAYRGSARSALRTHAFPHRTTTIWAQSTGSGGIDDSRAHLPIMPLRTAGGGGVMLLAGKVEWAHEQTQNILGRK